MLPLARAPVSHSHAEAIALEKNRDGGAGEGITLAKELAAILPDVEPSEIDRILHHYPAATITKTLDRVRKTPAQKIRKSKVALFRYLLAKFSQESDVDDL